MQDDAPISFPSGNARLVIKDQLKTFPAWDTAFASRCKDHRFYEIIEETLDCGFEHRYLVLEDQAGAVRGIQPLFFVQQNLVEGVPALRAAVATVRRRFPRFLTMRVLMVGCAGGESHLGVSQSEDENWMVEALRVALPECARRGRASLLVLKDFPATYRDALQSLTAHGYARVPSMPMTRLHLMHCDFEEFLNALSSKTRKDLRRKFRKAESASPIICEVLTDITPHLDEIYPLYLQVHERSALKFERLTKDYFQAVSQRMPDRARFFLWRQQGKVVAFNLCLVHDRTIFDEYLGLDYTVALDLHLYFYRLRDVLSWALANRLDCYYSSPLNYEPKLRFGSELVPLDLYVKHINPLLNPVFRQVVKLLEPTRHDPVLRQFSNAADL